MKLTNSHDLPPSVVHALTQSQYSKGDAAYSVTELIGPVMRSKLYREFEEHIEEDVMDRLWAFLGSTAHQVLQNAGERLNAFTEERLFMEVDGVRISGGSDLLEQTEDEYTITDYKFTSAYGVKFKGAVTPEFEAQLNLYRLLYHANGFTAGNLRLVYIFRDWRKADARNDRSHPQEPVMVAKVPVWTIDRAKEYLEERVRLHEEARVSRIREVAICSDHDRWFRPGNFGVMKNMKKGNKKSTKNFDTRQGAEGFISERLAEGHKDAKLYSVEERPGVEVRCASYCRVAPFCPYGRKVQAGLPEEERLAMPDDAKMIAMMVEADALHNF